MTEKFRDASLLASTRAKDLLSRLTLLEKVGQINQKLYGFQAYERKDDDFILTHHLTDEVYYYGGLGTLYGLYRADPWANKDFKTGITTEGVAKAYNKVQAYVISHSRFGIPALMSTECPHGHQALDGYLLPVNLAMGATFNPSLVEDAYKVCGAQMKSMGVNLGLISALDVLRDPRWGRSEECYSEDPYLSSRMAESAVLGCQSQGVTAVIKHFCAQGEGTGGINASAARIGERELREIHLPSTQAAIAAGAGGVMAAYNEIDGVPCHGSSHLLKDILRDEFGFKGVVMADGVAIDRLNALTGDFAKSGALALRSGITMSLWDVGFSKLKEAVEKGYITEAEIDVAALEILTLKFAQGLFEHPFLDEATCLPTYTYTEYEESLNLSRESVVLLKNENTLLPLQLEGVQSIAVIGPNADEVYHQLGDYTPPIKEDQGISFLSGLQSLVGDQVSIHYHKGSNIMDGTLEEVEEAVALATTCDLVILALGGSSSRFKGAKFDTNGAAILEEGSLQMDCGEGVDCAHLELSGLQNILAERIFALHKPTVSIIIAGRPYAISSIAKRTDALLYSFYPGPMGGQALAEIVLGKVCPSGRLPVSIPCSAAQLPVYYNFKTSYTPMIYHNEKSKPLYTFGDGLDYTTYDYKHIALCTDVLSKEALLQGNGFTLTMDITNTGTVSGSPVPLLFIKDQEASTMRREKELKAFAKSSLAPNETKTFTLTLNLEDLSIWNSNMQFTVEAGTFTLMLEDKGIRIWTGAVEVTN
ncbi:MAG: glycoside hydrolase family 3 N-terminal domain-containing protein [Niameybacter sp.]|uniref:glycoside hydrolase family 3 N-terminal domain-containing protein n=1 Tax=Niameybacter sp. TaxID=2033640 RepID=UPI002FC6AA46